ncbi:UNVERIFIED_CONTAM: putative mitochondrial protein [Sesamum latifolium]|uniref:Mitochondrial protein n=1 Tax=Sesamum latifolium TaxID=2727402 RepID=A0AAW2X5B8_9LAMI
MGGVEPNVERLQKAWHLTDDEEEGVILPSGLWRANLDSLRLCLETDSEFSGTWRLMMRAVHGGFFASACGTECYETVEMSTQEGFRDDEPLPYGPWLRAPNPTKRWKVIEPQKPSVSSTSPCHRQSPVRTGAAVFGAFSKGLSTAEDSVSGRRFVSSKQGHQVDGSASSGGETDPSQPVLVHNGEGRDTEMELAGGELADLKVVRVQEDRDENHELLPSRGKRVVSEYVLETVRQEHMEKTGTKIYSELPQLVNIPLKFTAGGLSLNGRGRRGRPPRRVVRGRSRKQSRGGVGSPWTVHTLKEIIRLHKPGLVFISETKCKARRCDRIKEGVNYHGLGVDSVGKGGGLLLLWRKDIEVWLQSFLAHHIDATVRSDDCPERWRFTGFYGYAELSKRKEGWELLRRLSRVYARPWLCAGDFNEVLNQHEKQGVIPRAQWQIKDFHDCLQVCGLQDLGCQAVFAQDLPCSDHSAIWVSLDGKSLTRNHPRKNRFRFKAAWCSSHDCAAVITNAWNSISEDDPRAWFGSLRKGFVSYKGSRSRPRVERSWVSSKTNWKSGWGMKKFCGNKGQKPTGSPPVIAILLFSIRRPMKDFESTHPTEEAMEEVVSCIQPRVTTAMNEALAQPFTSEEVTIALKQMQPLKSPGPDGMSPIFYQQYWFIVGPELASKVLANRVKPFLGDLISDSQSAFVPGRLIMDNVLLAYELNHFLKNKTWGRKGHASIKLDVSKGYDRVEWVFLERVLGRLGFNEGFVRLVMKCVSTVSFPFLLNGEQFGFLRPERGLRQGDPLSPYLFLLCAEAFSGLIRKAESEGTIEGVAVSRTAPSVSHLLFADDMLIFCQATKEALSNLQLVLTSFEAASGLMINKEKSAMVFSSNVESGSRAALANFLGVTVALKHDRYLGLPTVTGRSKKELFKEIKERIWKKLNTWSSKQLSQAGRAVLLKTVLQTIPTYAMICFRFPESLLNELEGLMADFFWNHGKESKIHWKAWFKLCKDKQEGGLRFRRLREFNAALLAKQAWRVCFGPNNVLQSVLSQKYFLLGTFFDSRLAGVLGIYWLLDYVGRWEMVHQFLLWGILGFQGCSISNLFAVRSSVAPTNSKSFSSSHGGQDLEYRTRVFSVRSAYTAAIRISAEADSSGSTMSWDFIWRSKAPPRVLMFAWRCAQDALPTIVRLRISELEMNSIVCSQTNPENWLREVRRRLSRVDWDYFLTICWSIWKARNWWLFEGKLLDAQDIIQ